MWLSVASVRAGLPAWLAACLALVLGGALLAPAPVRAEVGSGFDLVPCVAEQRPGDSAQAVLASPARFDCRGNSAGLGPGNYWVRLHLPPGAPMRLAREGSAAPHLTFVPQWQRAITVYTRDSDGTVLARTLDNADLSRLIRIGGAAEVALEGHRHPLTDVLLRIDGALNAAGLLGTPRLATAERVHADELVATAIFAAFAGLGIGLFCYNIVLWLTIRERFQLTYCLSLLAMMAYIWANSGAMALQFPGVPNDERTRVCYGMLGFASALALQFISDIMEPGTVPPRLRRMARHYGVVFVASAVAVAAAPDEWRYLADRIYVASFVPLPVLVVAITVMAWRRGSQAVRVLAVAWSLPLAMAMVRIAHALHFIPFGVLVQYSLVVGMSVEALLSSLAMSYRIKLITAERDRALSDERAARHLASVDSLTGLLNRRALLEQVIEWESPEPLRLLIVDIDQFKHINDTHGHLVGDEVIRAVAEVLAIRADLRASVARLGGEEFALVGTAAELGEGLALGILADVRSRPLAGVANVTVSVGMAEGLVRCEDEWSDLYRRADAALYRAKAEGRNRAVHDWPEDPARAEPPTAGQSCRDVA